MVLCVEKSEEEQDEEEKPAKKGKKVGLRKTRWCGGVQCGVMMRRRVKRVWCGC